MENDTVAESTDVMGHSSFTTLIKSCVSVLTSPCDFTILLQIVPAGSIYILLQGHLTVGNRDGETETTVTHVQFKRIFNDS